MKILILYRALQFIVISFVINSAMAFYLMNRANVEFRKYINSHPDVLGEGDLGLMEKLDLDVGCMIYNSFQFFINPFRKEVTLEYSVVDHGATQDKYLNILNEGVRATKRNSKWNVEKLRGFGVS